MSFFAYVLHVVCVGWVGERGGCENGKGVG